MTFAYVYNIGEETIVPEGNVTFNQTPVLGRNIKFSTPSSITIEEAGTYSVEICAIPKNANITLALFLNDEEIAGTRFTDISSTGSYVAHYLIVVKGEDLPGEITLKNVNRYPARIDNGQLEGTVSVSLLINRL